MDSVTGEGIGVAITEQTDSDDWYFRVSGRPLEIEDGRLGLRVSVSVDRKKFICNLYWTHACLPLSYLCLHLLTLAYRRVAVKAACGGVWGSTLMNIFPANCPA
jgi:hypothetical protein